MNNSLHARYGLKRVINASGRMSILGVSAPSDTVMNAMKIGGQKYVEVADLVEKAGQHIAEIIRAEDAVVVNSASSGIVLSVAAIVTEGDRRKCEKLHQEPISKNEIIMFKGHNVNFGAPVGTMVALGGGQLVEVGFANGGRPEDISEAINENTAAILYIKSHHSVQKNMLSVEEVWELSKKYNIPLIVDAAAEEDLEKYINLSDLAIFSGSKAIEGPTSGIVGGKSTYIQWLKAQFEYIGRSMKVGKESTFGLLQALDEFVVKEDTSEAEKEALKTLLTLDEIDGVKVEIIQDEAGREIYRARITIDEEVARMSAEGVRDKLRNGDIAIYTRDYGVRQGFFDIDARPLLGDDIDVIKSRLEQLLGDESNE